MVFMQHVLKALTLEKSVEQNIQGKNFVWNVYTPTNLGPGLKVLQLIDTDTGVKLLTYVHDYRFQSIIAWSGARHSRSEKESIEIIDEVLYQHSENIDADAKLARVYKAGHASVADMSEIPVFLDHVPMHVPLLFFNQGVLNSGQEKSTRYQKGFKALTQGQSFQSIKGFALTKNLLKSLEQKLESKELSLEELTVLKTSIQELLQLSTNLYEQAKTLFKNSFENFYKPTSDKEFKSLESRVLDSARYYLLLGNSTGFMFETTARRFSKLVSLLKSSEIKFYNDLAISLELLLAPPSSVEHDLNFKAGSPGLIKHTEQDKTFLQNINSLKNVLETQNFDLFANVPIVYKFQGLRDQEVKMVLNDETDKVIAQYIAFIWPGMNVNALLRWVEQLPRRVKTVFGSEILRNHDHHKELRQLARTTSLSFIIQASIGEIRDLNRHKSVGRFIQEMRFIQGSSLDYDTARQVVSKGYTLPLYAFIQGFEHVKQEMIEGFEIYYEKLQALLEKLHELAGDSISYDFIYELLPLAHVVNLWMHFTPQSLHYLTNLRVRPGGHVNYRQIAFEISESVKKAKPFFNSLQLQKPDLYNRQEFFSRD